jgi:hypothetical protein
MANLLSTTVAGSLSVNVDSSGSSISTVNNGNASRWYGRITTFNSTSDKSVFLGTYASVAVVGAHNNALTAWANLYVNNVDGVNGGNVYLPTNSYVANNSIIHSGNIGSQSVNYANSSGVTEFQSIPDYRGNAFTPNAYNGQRVWWHFNNTDTVGGYGTFWHAIQTVSPWTSYDSSHRQQQIQWGGTDISFRYATSGTTWSSWFRFITDANIASQSVSYADESGYSASSGSVEWTSVQNKPSTFTPSDHTHSISDVTGLQTALDGKLSTTGIAANSSQLEGFSAYALVSESRGAHSGSDFPNGTLVRTDINANVWAGDSFIMEVSGKSYGSGTPFKLIMEGYLYADTIINVSAMSYGSYFPAPVKVMRLDGILAFWWPRGSYWNSFEVHVRSANGDSWNRVTSIGDSVDPASGDKKISITPVQVLHTNNAGYAYNMNQNVRTDSGPTFANVYASGWFRNYGNQGIYNETYGTHFYSNSGSSWAITGSGGNIELQFRSNHQSTVRGYVYADTNNNIGFLNNGGGWALRTDSSNNAFVYGSNLTIGEGGANATNIVMGDGDEGARTIHCNSNRIGFLNQSGSWGSWCNDDGSWATAGGLSVAGNTSWFGGYGGGSGPGLALENQNTFARFAFFGLDFYDWDHGIQMEMNGNYVYVNNYLQAGNSLRAPIFYDSQDTGYYLDPNGSSNLLTVTINNTYVGNAIYFGGGNNYLNWTSGRIYSNVGIQSENSMRAPIFYDSENTGYYLDPNGTSNLYAIATNAYNTFNSWTNLTGSHGFYSSTTNNAHFYPNNASYGSWMITGSRNGWPGLEFNGLNNGNVSLMIGAGSDTTGFHNNSYGWQFYWSAGTLYCAKSTYGGGGASSVLDSSNSTYAWNMNQYVRTTDDVTHNSTTSPTFLVNSHSDNTKGYRIHNTSGSSVSAMFTNSSNQLVIAAGAVDQINLNKKVLVNGVALGVNVAPSGTAGRIDASNDIVAYSSSDERLKHNITPIENALDKVKSLTGVEFDWKPEYKHAHGYEGHDTGIIAQQVQEVIPSAVRTNDTGFLAVRYEKLIGLLVEGMKEQQAQIDELKAKLDGIAR